MTPFKLPLTIYQGATFRKSAVWKAGTPAVPVDLTGCIARMHIREFLDAPTTLLELTTENGRLVLGGVTGKVDMIVDATATTALTWTSGVYDLEIEFSNGEVRRLLQGAVKVSQEVTRE